MDGPEIVVHRDQIYDPSLEKWVNKELPTVTIKKAVQIARNTTVAQFGIVLEDSSLSDNTGISTEDGYGEVGRLTYLRIENRSTAVINLFITSAEKTNPVVDVNEAIEFITLEDNGTYEYFGNANDKFRTIEEGFGIYAAHAFTVGNAADTDVVNVSYEYTKRSVRR